MSLKNHKRSDTSTLGAVFAFLSTFCFGFQGILVKLAYAEETPLMAMLLWRKLMFLPFFWIFALWKIPRKKIFARKSDIFLSMFAGCIGYFLVPLLTMDALFSIDAVIERTLIFTYPVMVIIINSVIEKTWPTRKYILAFALMEIGTFFLIGGLSEKEIFHQNLFGAGEVLLAALVMAFFVIIIQTLVRRIGTISFMLWALTGATMIVIATSILEWQPTEFALSRRSFLLVALFSLASFPPAIMFAEGVKRIGGSKASLINSLTPLVTVLFGYLILDEILLPGQMLGVFIIILAVLTMQKKSLQIFIKRKQEGRKREMQVPLVES